MGKWFQTCMFITWVPTWVAAIWIRAYSGELFLTGLFALVLALVDSSGDNNQSSIEKET